MSDDKSEEKQNNKMYGSVIIFLILSFAFVFLIESVFGVEYYDANYIENSYLMIQGSWSSFYSYFVYFFGAIFGLMFAAIFQVYDKIEEIDA